MNDGLTLLVVIGFGGLVLWYLTRQQKAATLPPTTTQQCSGAGRFLSGISYGGVKVSCDVADTALDLIPDESESSFKKWGAKTLSFPVALNAAILTKILPESLQFGSTKVCRATNNKDVFPNDMHECATRYGITDCNTCGLKYDTINRRWPWTDPLKSETQASQPVTGKLPGFR